ncbi:4'-phosphopantetheinyl transferase family protein [Carnobacterium divergens]|uniref:4'-phosphopantetheinyl transferase family protein n=1 Tax=Carnobacterium divergens TaxID=2748 RepID=UPI00288CDD2C|nr:4'-phosphopantetheinyl transferase superfamily protein [Carnobacterium divergens]MDT2010941.1 4'-phosphopantetheinyl transferase superfamily protein [Carnobacterium divergens]
MLITNIIKIDTMSYHHLEKHYLDKLDIVRKSQITNFVNQLDKKRSIVAGLLLRKMLYCNFNLNPSELEFAIYRNGKPILVNNPCVFFNISHSNEFVACSVSSKPIGIDIEKIEDSNIDSIATVLHENEKQCIASKNNYKEKRDLFFKIWTLKEAFSKKIGLGLSYPLNEYYFSFFDNGKIIVHSEWENSCNFRSYGLHNSYVFSVSSSIVEQNKIVEYSLNDLIQLINCKGLQF